MINTRRKLLQRLHEQHDRDVFANAEVVRNPELEADGSLDDGDDATTLYELLKRVCSTPEGVEYLTNFDFNSFQSDSFDGQSEHQLIEDLKGFLS